MSGPQERTIMLLTKVSLPTGVCQIALSDLITANRLNDIYQNVVYWQLYTRKTLIIAALAVFLFSVS